MQSKLTSNSRPSCFQRLSAPPQAGTIWRRSPWIKIDCSIWFVKKMNRKISMCGDSPTVPNPASPPLCSAQDSILRSPGFRRRNVCLVPCFQSRTSEQHVENRTTWASENKWNFCSKVKNDTAEFHLCEVSGKANLQQQKIDQCLPGAGVGVGTNQKWV